MVLSEQSRFKFIFFIVVTSSIGQIAAEVYIPSLPYISRDFQVSSSLTQLSIAVFLFGMSLPGILFGYISDFFGRRKILLIATTLSSVGTLLCLMAPNIYVLILGRFIQGLGFSGVGSLSRAILRDRMSGVELARYVSYLAMITVLAIDISPFIGGFLQEYFGWRPIFALLLAYNLLAVYLSYQFKDNLSTLLNSHLRLNRILHIAWESLREPLFFKYNLLAALTYAAVMALLTVASFLFEHELGLSPAEFGATMLGLSFVYMFGAFVNGKLLHYFTMAQLVRNGIVVMWLSCIFLLVDTLFFSLSYWGLVSFIALLWLGCSALFANNSSIAFSVINKNIGVSSALFNTVQILFAAIITAAISAFSAYSTVPLSVFMVGICLGLTALFNWKIQSKEGIKL